MTAFGYDERGKCLYTCSYRWGAKTMIDPRVMTGFPEPKRIDADHDQVVLSLLDARGSVLLRQDASRHLTGLSYTPQGELARRWLTVTHWLDAKTKTTRLDEFVNERDALQNITSQTIYRVVEGQRELFDTTNFLFNTFGEDMGQDDGSNPSTHTLLRNLDGLVYFDNDQNKNQFLLRDLMGRAVVIVQSRTLDLSTITPETFQSIISSVKDPNDLCVTWITLDDEGSEILREMPQYFSKQGEALLKAGLDPNSSLPLIPIDIFTNQLMDTADQRQVPAFSWVVPSQTTVLAKTITLWPVTLTSASAIELPIILKEGRYWVNVTALPTGAGLYHFRVLYALQADPSVYLYQSAGVVPVISPDVVNSVTPVIYMEDESTACLTGKTADIQTIDLYQDNKASLKVATVPVERNPKTGLLSSDLSALTSGIYYFRPTGQTDLALLSPPLTVTTKQVPETPFGQVIPLQAVTVWHLDNHLQIDWNVPERFKSSVMRVVMELHHELGDHSEAFSVEFLLDPTKERTPYSDKEGRVLLCNASLEQGDTIRAILSLTMTLIIDDQHEVTLYNKMNPLLLGDLAQDSENVIRGIAFSPRTTLYYSGLALETFSKTHPLLIENDVILEYAPYQNSDLLSWIKLISVGVSCHNGAFFDITALGLGHYLARFAGVAVPDFTLGRCIVGSFDASTEQYVMVQPPYLL